MSVLKINHVCEHENRRKEKRYEYYGRISAQSDNLGETTGRIMDINLSGLSLSLTKNPNVGEELLIEHHAIGNLNSFNLKAIVRSVRSLESNEFKVGLEFETLRPMSKRAIMEIQEYATVEIGFKGNEK